MKVKQGFNKLKQIMRAMMSTRSNPGLDPETLKEMVQDILSTRPDEIGCDECFEQLDRFVDMTLAGKNAAEAMPLVQDHLERCRDCRQEFEALLAALRALA
jgi:hypothetical protein